ncbi:MAG: hypothetical protein H6561_08190 [Lewinellaceae bacterium]|nr:hypothetical protein [Lewinellaceae bacterium]
MHPQYMADFALREAENRPINIRIHSAEDIQREGLWGSGMLEREVVIPGYDRNGLSSGELHCHRRVGW